MKGLIRGISFDKIRRVTVDFWDCGVLFQQNIFDKKGTFTYIRDNKEYRDYEEWKAKNPDKDYDRVYRRLLWGLVGGGTALGIAYALTDKRVEYSPFDSSCTLVTFGLATGAAIGVLAPYSLVFVGVFGGISAIGGLTAGIVNLRKRARKQQAYTEFLTDQGVPSFSEFEKRY